MQRQLSTNELTVLMAWHCGISPAQYQAITEAELVVAEDPDEVDVLEWTQSHRLNFLLLAAHTYGRPN